MRWILPLALTTALGSAQQSLVNIDTVLVGDPGNPEMFYNKRGSVPYEFKIGKYEVTIEQYVAFLNSVASVTTNAHLADLWHNGMESDPTVAGISRSGAGSSTDPFVYEPMGMAQRPIAYISWFNAARFCNWLHNGAIHGASTEIGAYTLDGMLSDQWRKPTRNAGARWWLPTENEWFKAGHYDPSKPGTVPYHGFPVRVSTPPGNSIGLLPYQANHYHFQNGFSVTQSTNYNSNQSYLTPVGAFSGSASYYGTYDQGGNLWEWTETLLDSGRILMGGFWYFNWTGMELTKNPSKMVASSRTRYQGFRVAGFSPPRVTEAVRKPEGFSLSWSRGATNVSVQRTTSLEGNDWTNISTSNSSGTFLDNSSPTDRAFYRLIVP